MSSPDQIVSEHPRATIFKSNERLLQSLYRSAHPKSDLVGVKEGDYVNDATVLIAAYWGNTKMTVCPECGSKLDADVGVAIKCDSRRCKGKEQVAARKAVYRLFAGDVNGNNVTLSFFPSTFEMDDQTATSLIGKVVKISGRIGRPSKSKNTGEELPGISVNKLSIVDDVLAEGLPLQSFEEATLSAQEVAPTPVTPTLSSEKLAKIKSYMYAMSNSVAPEQLSKYLETTAGLKLSDVDSLLELTETPSGKFYKLKGFTLEQLKSEVRKSVPK